MCPMHTEQREMYALLHINLCAVHICDSCVWTSNHLPHTPPQKKNHYELL